MREQEEERLKEEKQREEDAKQQMLEEEIERLRASLPEEAPAGSPNVRRRIDRPRSSDLLMISAFRSLPSSFACPMGQRSSADSFRGTACSRLLTL